MGRMVFDTQPKEQFGGPVPVKIGQGKAVGKAFLLNVVQSIGMFAGDMLRHGVKFFVIFWVEEDVAVGRPPRLQGKYRGLHRGGLRGIS